MNLSKSGYIVELTRNFKTLEINELKNIDGGI
ncbi:bacteriocin [Clostridium estertheticum]|uniref:Bacteriocin n=1 Tax=Clostridium estertheticum TaxID=238834 RepID=A0A7Y3SX68_9CLOT|nr:bacteriocin [Clostridium estertheticum]